MGNSRPQAIEFRVMELGIYIYIYYRNGYGIVPAAPLIILSSVFWATIPLPYLFDLT